MRDTEDSAYIRNPTADPGPRSRSISNSQLERRNSQVRARPATAGGPRAESGDLQRTTADNLAEIGPTGDPGPGEPPARLRTVEPCGIHLPRIGFGNRPPAVRRRSTGPVAAGSSGTRRARPYCSPESPVRARAPRCADCSVPIPTPSTRYRVPTARWCSIPSTPGTRGGAGWPGCPTRCGGRWCTRCTSAGSGWPCAITAVRW